MMTPEQIQSRVLFRDALMLVLDKPAGIAVHAGPKGGENLEEYFEHLRYGYHETPGLAHRLDRDTSGCLVLGRNKRALSKLGKLFAGHFVEKRYWAVVHGQPPEIEGTIDLPLRKRTEDRRSWWMEAHADGQAALTHYRVLGRTEKFSWIEFAPQTGRTHQIRVHAAALGCPLLGDTIYGAHDGRPLHLHAQRVSVPLYFPKPPIGVTAAPPGTMQAALRSCGWEPQDGKERPDAS